MYGKQQTESGHEGLRNFVRWIVDIMLVIILAVMAIRFYGDRTTIVGSSMNPVLESNDVVLLDKLCYTFSEPERFDVICFTVEQEGKSGTYVKRIIGLPGETVQITGGLVLINGECPDPENVLYQAAVSGMASEPITLGAGEYFVLGDNRAGSEDSRFSNVGNVNFSQITGRLWLIYSPFLRMGLIK
ncbi:MAG: signal peptidase I [Lachnospiraceae bacterium]|nr:signal peptidase I [Lachnospiraceae bacterium]